MMAASHLVPVDTSDLPDYPLRSDERLDSHFFVPWERRRWLNSDMRLHGTPECRALYFDLINVSYDHSPVGTLPTDLDTLAKLLFADPAHFKALCRLEYGPLHRWEPCLCDTGQVRLMHPTVLRTLTEAIGRREDNRARTEAANVKKRVQRLRVTVAGLHVELAKNDAAVRWMDDWLSKQGYAYRSTDRVEQAMLAWSGHMAGLSGRRGSRQ